MPDQQQLITWRQDDLRGVLLHEGTHMFVHYAFAGAGFEPGAQTPWFQEGFAEYFGGHKREVAVFGGERKTIIKLGYLLPGRYGQYQRLKASGQLLSLESLVKVTQPAFLGARDQPGEVAARALVENVYAQGWVLVMYLNHAHGGKYKTAFDDYFMLETKGGGNWESFAKLLNLESEDDWVLLEQDFRTWADRELPNVNEAG